jgi:fatty-acyl-CoA synthase
MKLAFSTLGCPGWSFNEIFATAKDLGLDGIEIRGLGSQMYVPKAAEFNAKNIDKTKEFLIKTGLKVSMLTSDAAFDDKNTMAASVKAAKEYIDLAVMLGCNYVRVLGERTIYPEKKPDLGIVREGYTQVLDYASGKNVFPLLETNGVFADTKVLSEFIRSLNRSNAFVLWDIHHPYRVFSETAEVSAKNLEGLVKYAHVKDSVLQNSHIQYRMMGYGDVPVLDCLKQLKKSGFDSYISLEWVKRWQPDLSEPGIVFSHYVNYMNYLLRQL